MRSRENSERISHVLGNYEIFEELGRGGMGIVYRGLDLSLDRPVAVKVLRDDLRMQSTIVTRFAREARAAAALDHPNIVQIYSVGEVHRTPYIAMELVDSEALSAIMIREGTLPWQRALKIGSQVAAALASAHDAQIIHRDVKPPNILMTDDDKAYVTDFGIAKILSMHDQLTVDGTKLGTPQYMSPERCKTGDASASSDLYSLGVLLFQMISGRLPHEGATATELVRRILSQPPARLRYFAPDAPDEVERMVAWLIESRPELRPASAMVARDAIERVLAGERLDINDSAASRAILDFRSDTNSTKRRRTHGRRNRVKRTSQPRAARSRRLALGAAALAAVVLGWGAGALMNPRREAMPAPQHEVSNWYVSKYAASFLREAQDVWIAHLANPTMTIRNVVWNDSTRSFMILTADEGNDGVGSRRAILAVQPATRNASAIVPRLGIENHVVNLNLTGSTGTGFVGLGEELTLAPGGMTASMVRDAVANVVGDRRTGDVSHVAFHPSGSRILCVLREPGGRKTLYEQALGDAGMPHFTEFTIEAAGYSADGTFYFFTVRDSDGVLMVYTGDSFNDPILTWQGVANMTPGGVHPDGSHIVVTGQGTALIEVPITNGGVERVLGEGAGAVWLNSERVVALARDTRGQWQVWVVSIKDDTPRKQLSFIEGGVHGPLAVSSDGAWIAAQPSTGNRAAVLLLHVPGQTE